VDDRNDDSRRLDDVCGNPTGERLIPASPWPRADSQNLLQPTAWIRLARESGLSARVQSWL